MLEEKHVLRLGSEKRIHVDVRIIGASQHRLLSLVKQRRFRDDLYSRLALWVIFIPPLRQRNEDIKLLAHHFVLKHRTNGEVLSGEALAKLCKYDWPGNVRELESCIVRALIQTEGRSVIGPDDIEVEEMQWQNHEAERQYLENALATSGGCIKRAARLLQVHRNTVYNRMAKFGIDAARFKKQPRGLKNGGRR